MTGLVGNLGVIGMISLGITDWDCAVEWTDGDCGVKWTDWGYGVEWTEWDC